MSESDECTRLVMAASDHMTVNMIVFKEMGTCTMREITSVKTSSCI